MGGGRGWGLKRPMWVEFFVVPAEQGLVSMTGTFIDTIIICTMTGLVLVVSGVWTGDLNGAAMTQSAFAMAFPAMAKYLLMIGLVLLLLLLFWVGIITVNAALNTFLARKVSCLIV